MTDITLKAFVWNEHEEPQEIRYSGNFDRLQNELMQHLENKEYGKLVKTYLATEKPSWPEAELVLHYRAFGDEYRGRQIVSGADLADLDRAYQEQKRLCSQKVFSPAELYALKPIQTDYDSWHTVAVHFSEDINYSDIDLTAVMKSRRMETRTIVNYDYDGRRGWTLQTVWFDEKPVMVVNSSGRDGDEYHERWITDAKLFGELVAFLRSFTPLEVTVFVTASAKIPAMTEFYNHSIHDYYDVTAQEAKKS